MSGDLDHVIDDVAREMTSVPAADGLVDRVRLRIETDVAARRAVSMKFAFLVPLAAIGILVVAVFVTHDKAPVEQFPAPAANVSRAPTVVTPNDERAVANVSSVVPVRTASTTRIEPSPLPPIEIPPVEIERLDVTPMVQAQQLEIEIDPIAIARIEISPMP